MSEKSKKIIYILIQIFLIGLLLHFFLHTSITFKLGGTGTFRTFFRAWKEILILALLVFILWLILKNKRGTIQQHVIPTKAGTHTKNKILVIDSTSSAEGQDTAHKHQHISIRNKIKSFRSSYPLKMFVIVFIITLIVIFIISLFNANIIRFLVSVRYSMIGFMIFISGFTLSRLLFNFKDLKIIHFYQNIIKRVLVLALGWRAMLIVMPTLLSYFGYSQTAIEGEVGQQPPATYLSEYNTGTIRNQFIFERPITFGFRLIAFRPLLYIGLLRKKKKTEIIGRTLIYMLLIFSTYSRAARGVWIFQTTILLMFVNNKKPRKTLLYFIVPIIIIILGLGRRYRSQLLSRYYSDTGHVLEIKRALYIIQDHTRRGKGAGTAGPASHQIKEVFEFNTENQYLQIRVEYGLIALLLRMYMYLYLHWIGYQAYRKNQVLNEQKKKVKKIKSELNWIVFAFALGLLGLSIEGLVLHSFVDRMVVYPFMLLFGIVYGVYRKNLL